MSLSIKSFLPRTLFGRSLLILVTPVLLLQAISIFVFFDRYWSKMTERLSLAAAGEIAVISMRIEHDPKPEMIRAISSSAIQYLGLLVSYEPGATLPPGGKSAERPTYITKKLIYALDEQIRRPYRVHVDMNERWVEVRVALEHGVLVVYVPQERLFTSTGYIFLLWMIFSSVILLAVAILFMRNQIRPIRRLAVAAERIGKGRDLPSTLKPEGAYEVRQAARAFIVMHERIRRQISQRTAMLAGVSHDLRTPLTRLKLHVAMLEKSQDTAAMKADIDEMQRMLDAYLDFVRGDGGETASRTDLSAILDRLIQGLRRTGVDAHLDVVGDLNLPLRSLAFERCLGNILGNAGKYAKTVWIKAERLSDSVLIVVDDNGPGIPEDQLNEVFKPFFRVDESRNADTGGVGLGLSIAQDIVHSHGGEISLRRSDRGGLCVEISLPV